jgi:hypothetical protein
VTVDLAMRLARNASNSIAYAQAVLQRVRPGSLIDSFEVGSEADLPCGDA